METDINICKLKALNVTYFTMFDHVKFEITGERKGNKERGLEIKINSEITPGGSQNT